MFKMMRWFLKILLTLHRDDFRYRVGVPQREVSGESELTLLGTLA
jgi:hypothetical protein